VSPRVMRALRRGLRHDLDARWPSMTALIAELSPRSRAAYVYGGLGVGAVAAVVAATVLSTSSAADPRATCRAGNQAIDRSWPGRSGELARALGVPLDGSTAAGRNALGALDRYAGTLRSMRLDACVADGARDPATAPVAQAQLRCLDGHRQAMDDMLGERIANPKGGLEATRQMADLLPSNQDCAASTVALRPPVPAASLVELSSLSSDLERAERLRQRDQFAESRAIMARLGPRAEALAYQPFLAEVVFEQALQVWGSNATQSRALLERASELATASHHDRVAANALKLQIIEAMDSGDKNRMDALIPLARAAAERYADPGIQAEVALAIGLAWTTVGKGEAGGKLCSEALDQLAPTSTQRANGYNCLAQAALARGDLPAADEAIAAELKLVEEQMGSDSSGLVTGLDQLSYLRSRQGRLDDALAALERSRAISVRVSGEDSRAVVGNDLKASRLLVPAGRLDEALTRSKHAVALAGKVDQPPGSVTVGAEVQLAEVLRAQGKLAEARPHYEAGILLGKQVLASSANSMIQARFNYANALAAAGELDRAGELYDELEQVMQGQHDKRIVLVRLAKAEIVMTRDGCAKAIPVFTDLLRELEAQPGASKANVLMGKMELGDCLWETRDRKGARAMVDEVKVAAAAAGKAGAPLLAQAEAWLAKHR